MDGEDLGLIDGTSTEEAFGGDGGEELDPELGGGDGGEETPPEPGAEGSEKPAGQVEDKTERLVPAKFRESFKKIKELDPQLAKDVSRAFYKVAQVDRLGKTAELTAFKQAIEERGGVDQIEQDYAELEASRQLEKGFEMGDPRVVDGWAEDYPDGFKRIAPAVFDKLEKLDGESYDQLVSRETDKTFSRLAVYETVSKIGAALEAGKTEDATKAYNDLVKFLGQMKALAGKSRSEPYSHKERELTERESSLEERDRRSFFGGVRTQVDRDVTGEMNRLLRNAIKGPVKADMANRLRRAIISELRERVNTNPSYQRQYTAVMDARNHERAVRFIVQNAKQKLSTIVREVLRYPEYAQLTRPRGSNNGAGGGGQRRSLGSAGGGGTVTGKPKATEVDFTRTDKALFLLPHGQAFLKNGKIAKW